jgi:hypothetical protein
MKEKGKKLVINRNNNGKARRNL